MCNKCVYRWDRNRLGSGRAKSLAISRGMAALIVMMNATLADTSYKQCKAISNSAEVNFDGTLTVSSRMVERFAPDRHIVSGLRIPKRRATLESGLCEHALARAVSSPYRALKQPRPIFARVALLPPLTVRLGLGEQSPHAWSHGKSRPGTTARA